MGTKIMGCVSGTKACILPAILRAGNECMVTSILLMQTRSKMSKASPFPRRNNPMTKEREALKKAWPGMGKITKDNQLDRPMFIDSPGMIFSDYLPIRRFFFFTPAGLKERWNAFKNGLWTIYSLAHVKKHCKPFKLKEFAKDAQDLYIEVNNAVMRKDKQRLQDLATSSTYLSLRKEFFIPDKNIHWRFVSAVSRPKVVHVRANPVEEKTNVFAQATVRIHSKQVFAIKDKHGRHVKGSDKQVKEVVDYVVFERHLTNKYGKWRVCGKLFPQPLRQKPSSELQLTGKNVPAV
ncbi:large ribosomal subunit protein mL45-like isoform X1 [Montipora capricornis]|uniref:large ribosomal subunit protein mL45-like isoform X1 n=1 Tax=Montipora capricornis TaxID=246305 RepID=UPI0035F13071